ncbi:MAG: DUF962 domain-containing protein [Geminicoccaceae bacterium]
MRDAFIEQMAMYTAYHRDVRNQLTHCVGVPAIAFALMLLLAYGPTMTLGGVEISFAHLLVVSLLLFYTVGSPVIGLIATCIYLPMAFLAQWLAAEDLAFSLSIFAVCFFGGVALQLWGHVFEGRKPALLDNVLQIFLAPSFIIAEGLFALGLQKDLHDIIESRSRAYAEQPAGAAG